MSGTPEVQQFGMGRFGFMPLEISQLTLLDESKEVRIRTRVGDRTFTTIIWIVVSNDVVFVRSVDGEKGRWYQRALVDPDVDIIADGQEISFRAVHVDDSDEIGEVTGALRAKYRPGGSLDRMTRDEVLRTTLRLEPAG